MKSLLRPPKLTNWEVVTCALAELGGIDKAIHLEDVAIKAHELAPGAFRWDLDEYSRFVDKDKVRVSLTDAEKLANGGLVLAVGASKRGQSKRTDLWRLTERGALWVVDQQPRVVAALGGRPPRVKKGKEDRLRRRLGQSPLYQAFVDTGGVPTDEYAFTDLLECSPDAANSVVERRFAELSAQVVLIEDPELRRFVAACRDAYPGMLGGGPQ